MLYGCNWRALWRGPQPGVDVMRFWSRTSLFVVAGEQLAAGDLVVTGRDGKIWKAAGRHAAVIGFAMHAAGTDRQVKVSVEGGTAWRPSKSG